MLTTDALPSAKVSWANPLNPPRWGPGLSSKSMVPVRLLGFDGIIHGTMEGLSIDMIVNNATGLAGVRHLSCVEEPES